MKKINFMRKALCLAVVMILTSSFALTAQTYRYIKGWPKEANDRIESFELYDYDERTQSSHI